MGHLIYQCSIIMNGCPAAGMKVYGAARQRKSFETLKLNADGRNEAAAGHRALPPAVQRGGRVWRRQRCPEPVFIDVVPIDFGIADAQGHNTAMTPGPYSLTYRGSEPEGWLVFS
jgi:5-hydroxyisourate hydrolase